MAVVKEWFVKFLAREAYIPIALIVIATVALFMGYATFSEWTIAAGGSGVAGVFGVLAKKKIENGKP